MGRRVLLMLLAAVAAVLAVWEASRRRAAALVAGGPGPADALEATTPERKAPSSDPAETDVAAAKRFVPPPIDASDLADLETEEVDGEIVDPHAEMTIPAEAQAEAEKQQPKSGYESCFRSIAWEPLGEPRSPDATELQIGFELAASVMELARIDVRETPSQVFVTVIARMTAEDGSGWFAYTRGRQATVTLDAPLGERELVHAPVDQPPQPHAASAENPAGPGHHAPANGDL